MTAPNTPQPASRQPEPVSGKRVTIDAPRLWGGGVATAVVAALAAAVGVLVCGTCCRSSSSSRRC